MFYPAGRPCCIWHKSTDCVVHNGWVSRPRTAVNESEVCAVWPKFYVCGIRRNNGEHPYSFAGHDPIAIELADVYVQRVTGAGLERILHGVPVCSTQLSIKCVVLWRAVLELLGFENF